MHNLDFEIVTDAFKNLNFLWYGVVTKNNLICDHVIEKQLLNWLFVLADKMEFNVTNHVWLSSGKSA